MVEEVLPPLPVLGGTVEFCRRDLLTGFLGERGTGLGCGEGGREGEREGGSVRENGGERGRDREGGREREGGRG